MSHRSNYNEGRVAISDYFGVRNNISFKQEENIHYSMNKLREKMVPRRTVDNVVQYSFDLLRKMKQKDIIFIDVYTGLGGMLYGFLDQEKLTTAFWYESDEKLVTMVEKTLESYKFSTGEETRVLYAGESKEFNGIPEIDNSHFVVYFDTIISNTKKSQIEKWLRELNSTELVIFRLLKDEMMEDEIIEGWTMEKMSFEDSIFLFFYLDIYKNITIHNIEKVNEPINSYIPSLRAGREVVGEEDIEWRERFRLFLDKFLAKTLFPEKEEREKYMTEKAMEFWERSFTHESFNDKNNYETLETLGDRMLEAVFSRYMLRRFQELDKHTLTTMKATYMSKQYQSQISQSNGFGTVVRIRGGNVNKHIFEDVFEAFFGALVEVSDIIMEGLGYINSYRLISYLFSNVNIDFSLARGKAISLMDQMFNRLSWGKPTSTVENLPNGSVKYILHMTNAAMIYLSQKGFKNIPINIGIGLSKTEKIAKQNAFEDMQNKLATFGITVEWSIEEKEASSIIDYPQLQPFIEDTFIRLKKEGFIQFRFFVPKTLNEKGIFRVQLMGINPDNSTTLLGLSEGPTLIQAKQNTLRNYSQNKM